MNSNYLENEYYVLSYIRDESIHDQDYGVYGATLTQLMEITKNSVILTLPGAFTPTCTTYHVPSFESNYEKIKSYGFDDVYVLTSNDFYTQREWFDSMYIKKLKIVSDIDLSFGNLYINTIYRPLIGNRNRREIFIFKDNKILTRFSEQYLQMDDDPFIETTIDKLLSYLESSNQL